MCGIALAVNTTTSPVVVQTTSEGLHATPWASLDTCDLLPGLFARGPDHLGTQTVQPTAGTCRLSFAASLLQLRGNRPHTSPYTSSSGHILCFNGEVFGGLNIEQGQNDGERLLAALTVPQASVPDVLSQIRGPWSVLFWDSLRQRLWFGRDVLGRRSLLVHFPDESDPRLLMTSVSELPATRGAQSAAAQAGQLALSEPAASPRAGHTGSPLASAAAPVPLCQSAYRQADADAGGATCPVADTTARGPTPATGAAGSTPSGAGSGNLSAPAVAGPQVGQRAGTAAAHVGSAGDTEDPEPSGTDGYWTELPPGLYSVSFGLPANTLPAPLPPANQAEHVTSAAPAPASPPSVGTCRAVDRQGGACDPRVVWELRVGGIELVVERHAWRDPVLLDLEAYSRAESRVAACGGAAGGEGPECDGAECDGPMAQPVYFPQPCAVAGNEEAAHVLLRVLLAAVRVRCACIETRSPHPAAAFTAAAEALASASADSAARRSAPQPSWRADNPLDFRTRTVPGGADGSHSTHDPRVGAHVHSGSGDGGGGPAGGAHGTSLAADDAPVMILFSGGVDSVLLAALAHQALPQGVPIDLSNVCFAGGTSPDREAARAALEELAAACPGRRWRLVEVDAGLEDVDRHRQRLLALLRPAGTVMDLNIGAALWLAVSGQGTLRLPSAAGHARAGGVTANSALGGDAAVPPTAGGAGGDDAASDGKQAPRQEALECDEWSCASQVESGREEPCGLRSGQFYGSAARVVLLGHGADEQCGGYGRHRTRFRSGGVAGLSGELEVDMRRLWLRNLGRDDRLVSDWGREARHPFLDEEVVGLLLRLPLECILDLGLPPGEGDKRLLRRCLQLLGLPASAARVKRAIQFGSRIGKMANRRDFGSNRAANRKNAGGVALQDVPRAAAEVAANAWSKGPKARPH